MLFVLNSLAVGGTEKKVVNIANALARNGTKVELAYLDEEKSLLQTIDSSITVTNLHRRGKYSFSALRHLRDIVMREQHAVFAVNQYPLLYVVPAVKWSRSKRLRVIGLINSPIGKRTRFEKVYGLFLNKCDEVVFGYDGHRNYWVRKYGLSVERVSVIYNGVDCEKFSPTMFSTESDNLRRKLEIPKDALVIGTVGRFRPEKTLHHLIAAIALLNRSGREIFALLLGNGEELEKLKEIARKEGVSERIKFVGEQLDVRPGLMAMDIFVLPSSLETFSNAALEAMAMARPVVLSEVGGAAEMIENGKSGALYPAGNIAELTEILAALCDSHELRHAMGAAARERAKQLFGYEQLVRRYRDLAVG